VTILISGGADIKEVNLKSMGQKKRAGIFISKESAEIRASAKSYYEFSKALEKQKSKKEA
jgi:hypothetical protein